MKLTEREQNLLFILGIIAVAIIGFRYLYVPAKAKYQALQVEAQAKAAEEVEAKEVMALAATIEQDRIAVEQKMEAVNKKFFKRAKVEYIHKWISMLAESNSLVVKNLDITEEALITVPVYGNEFVAITYPIGDYYNAIYNSKNPQDAAATPTTETAAPSAPREDDAVLKMDINVSVSGTNVQLMNFVNYLSNLGKHIVVKSFAFSDRQSTDIQEADVTLSIYTIDKEEDNIFNGYFDGAEKQIQEGDGN